MWRPDCDGDHAHVQTAIEGGDEVNTRGINQGHVVTGVQTTCNVVIVSINVKTFMIRNLKDGDTEICKSQTML